jgi:hypothetical protein
MPVSDPLTSRNVAPLSPSLLSKWRTVSFPSYTQFPVSSYNKYIYNNYKENNALITKISRVSKTLSHNDLYRYSSHVKQRLLAASRFTELGSSVV